MLFYRHLNSIYETNYLINCIKTTYLSWTSCLNREMLKFTDFMSYTATNCISLPTISDSDNVQMVSVCEMSRIWTHFGRRPVAFSREPEYNNDINTYTIMYKITI